MENRKGQSPGVPKSSKTWEVWRVSSLPASQTIGADRPQLNGVLGRMTAQEVGSDRVEVHESKSSLLLHLKETACQPFELHLITLFASYLDYLPRSGNKNANHPEAKRS